MAGATTPDGIPYPTTGDDLTPLESWFAGQAAGVQTALTNFRAGKGFTFRGAAASIGGVTGMATGDYYQETDGNKRLWRYDGASWKLWTDVWRPLTHGAGFTNLDSAGSAYRLHEGWVTVRVSATGTIGNGVTANVATGLPVDMRPPAGSPLVRSGIGAGSGGFVVLGVIYPAGHASAGNVAVANYSGGDRGWAGGYFAPYPIY